MSCFLCSKQHSFYFNSKVHICRECSRNICCLDCKITCEDIISEVNFKDEQQEAIFTQTLELLRARTKTSKKESSASENGFHNEDSSNPDVTLENTTSQTTHNSQESEDLSLTNESLIFSNFWKVSVHFFQFVALNQKSVDQEDANTPGISKKKSSSSVLSSFFFSSSISLKDEMQNAFPFILEDISPNEIKEILKSSSVSGEKKKELPLLCKYCIHQKLRTFIDYCKQIRKGLTVNCKANGDILLLGTMIGHDEFFNILSFLEMPCSLTNILRVCKNWYKVVIGSDFSWMHHLMFNARCKQNDAVKYQLPLTKLDNSKLHVSRATKLVMNQFQTVLDRKYTATGVLGKKSVYLNDYSFITFIMNFIFNFPNFQNFNIMSYEIEEIDTPTAFTDIALLTFIELLTPNSIQHIESNESTITVYSILQLLKKTNIYKLKSFATHHNNLQLIKYIENEQKNVAEEQRLLNFDDVSSVEYVLFSDNELNIEQVGSFAALTHLKLRNFKYLKKKKDSFVTFPNVKVLEICSPYIGKREVIDICERCSGNIQYLSVESSNLDIMGFISLNLSSTLKSVILKDGYISKKEIYSGIQAIFNNCPLLEFFWLNSSEPLNVKNLAETFSKIENPLKYFHALHLSPIADPEKQTEITHMWLRNIFRIANPKGMDQIAIKSSTEIVSASMVESYFFNITELDISQTNVLQFLTKFITKLTNLKKLHLRASTSQLLISPVAFKDKKYIKTKIEEIRLYAVIFGNNDTLCAFIEQYPKLKYLTTDIASNVTVGPVASKFQHVMLKLFVPNIRNNLSTNRNHNTTGTPPAGPPPPSSSVSTVHSVSTTDRIASYYEHYKNECSTM